MDNIEDLKKELEAVNNRLIFERNMYESRLEELRSDIYNKIDKNMKLNIENLRELSESLDPENGRILRMIARSIEQTYKL